MENAALRVRDHEMGRAGTSANRTIGWTTLAGEAKSCRGRRGGEEEKCSRKAFSKRRMDDLNLHIIFFSVLLACAQSFIQTNKMGSEEEVKCEDTGSDKFSN